MGRTHLYTYEGQDQPKKRVKKKPCWNDEMVMELTEKGWASKQETINEWIDFLKSSRIVLHCREP